MRPTFENILTDLDNIVHSKFLQTPHESFHIMQDDWKEEIEVVLIELRMKEKVRIILLIFSLSYNLVVDFIFNGFGCQGFLSN